LIERNRRQSQYFGIKLKELVSGFLAKEGAVDFKVMLAVAENPIDGMDAGQLFSTADVQLNNER
jgi:hypothetical protein